MPGDMLNKLVQGFKRCQQEYTSSRLGAYPNVVDNPLLITRAARSEERRAKMDGVEAA